MTLGRKSKTYYSIGGAADPTWVEVEQVGDVNQPDSRGSTDIDTRESDFTKIATGQRKIELGFNLKLKNGNAQFEALRDAYIADEVIGMANYIGDMTDVGAQGMHMDCKIIDFPINLPLKDWANADIKLAPAYDSDFEPVLMETTE
ncbi:hypothetical protein [Paremcibacter congregatus]|uniref:hypothetical protein n=1 Tax=Paremcibacter congregatus TaxID=2043170 RepID=UPI003A90E072